MGGWYVYLMNQQTKQFMIYDLGIFVFLENLQSVVFEMRLQCPKCDSESVMIENKTNICMSCFFEW